MKRKNRYKKTTRKSFWIILLILILPGFLLWGSESIVQHIQFKNYVGIIFGQKVTSEEFQRALTAIRHELMLQKGEEFLKKESEIDLTTHVWDRIILLKEAKRRKIKISDKEVRDFIKMISLFRSNNEFNFELYRRIVQYFLKTSERIFEEEIRESLMISKLYDEITADVKLTEDEIWFNYQRENEMIAIDYLSVPFKELEKNIDIDEKRLYQYYLDNRPIFRKPSNFNLQYIIDEDPRRIKNISSEIKKVKNFETFLKEKGYIVKETDFFGIDEPIPGIEWSLSLSFLIEKLKVGQILGPIKIKDKYLLIRLKQKRESYIPLFNEIKDKVKEEYVEQESKRIARDILLKVLSEIKNMQNNNLKIDFSELAKIYNLQEGTTELFKRSSYIPQLGESDRFFMAFSNLKEEEIGKEIVEMERAFFIVKIKNYKAADEIVYKKEKDEFTRALISKIKDIKFIDFLGQLRKKTKIKIEL
ncbi:MAG: SurA N-terminal domain-containing protein [Candidatus Omnitrophica bacterium]|nr:SurA N-terminal domain-containing protein [Candidatus Omnitrophota bacterium]